uniref:Uncharacterized protein n=1 Tax=Setaria viridis TaxID=4556 RepID=A0A4U6T1X1_SETVI|nr:hypothetical protein SEVIR_9G049832v2 [Setaria viridis]
MRGVAVGMEPMFYALRALCNPNSSSMEVRLALYQFVIRFPPWLRRYLAMLRYYEAEPLSNNIFSFDSYFSDWSTMCKRIRRGAAAFEHKHIQGLLTDINVGVVPNSLQDIGRASDGAEARRQRYGIYTLARVSRRLDSLVSCHRCVT